MTKAKLNSERDRGPNDPAPSPIPGPIEPKPRPSPKTPSARLRALVPAVPLSILQLIDRYARDKDVDPAKYRALLEMQKEVQLDEAERELARDYNRLVAALPRIKKDGLIVIDPKPGKRGQQTPYVTLDSIMNALWPILREHHFGFQWHRDIVPVGANGGLQEILYGTLQHDNGRTRVSKWVVMPEGTGSKNSEQARGSGDSYGKRYTLRHLVPFVSFLDEDRDDDGAGANAIEEGALVSKEQAKTLNKAIKDCGVAREAFEQHFGPPEKLPLARYDEAIARCKQFGERLKGETKNAAA